MNGRKSAAVQLELPLVSRTRIRTAGETIRAVRLGGRVLTYRLRRSTRRTLALYVDHGGVRAAAPRWIAVAEVERFIRDKERWILTKLAESASSRLPPFEWREGQVLRVFGEALRITLRAAAGTVDREDDALVLPAACGEPQRMRLAVLAWIQAGALERFRLWAATLAPRLEVTTPQVLLSNASTRWGSCSIRGGGTGVIRLNWRLALLGPDLAEYVVAHELAHLREMNHSRRFWAWVARAYPDYRRAERDLRRQGRAIPAL